MMKAKNICYYEDCKTLPSYNYPDESKAITCSKHRIEGMINVFKKKCIFNGCNTEPKFNNPSEIKGLFCSKHKELNMVNVVSKKCFDQNCNKPPLYKDITNTSLVACKSHATENMVSKYKKYTCIQENCKKNAFYKYKGCPKIYCSEHKKPYMVSSKKTCAYETCVKFPIFNIPTEKTGLYCVTHKEKNMINIKSKKCKNENCMLQPTYGFEIDNKSVFCKTHKEAGMIDVHNRNKICQELHCKIRASYNYIDNKKPIFCAKHQKNNMVIVTNKLCEELNCNHMAYYGIMYENPTHCVLHKSDEMVSMRGRHCEYPECNLRPSYGFLGKKSLFCVQHKLDNMVYAYEHNKCQTENCMLEYEFIVDDVKYCVNHCPNKEYISAIKKTCKYCDIDEHSIFVCNECENTKNKIEWSVVRYLKKNIKREFIYNSSGILQGCSANRPDIYFELYKHVIIVEIDEDQHKRYTDLCECARLNQIVNGIGGLSVIFIRFNPDKIKNNRKSIEIPLIERLDKLINIINDEIIKEYDQFVVKLVQLYYDDNYDCYQYMKIEDITNAICI